MILVQFTYASQYTYSELPKVILCYNGYCSQIQKKFMQNVGRCTGILPRREFLPYLDGTLTLPFEKQAKQLVWSTYTYMKT